VLAADETDFHWGGITAGRFMALLKILKWQWQCPG
jgi:hypothetical protein